MQDSSELVDGLHKCQNARMSRSQYLNFIHIHRQPKPPLLKLVVGVDADTIFIRDKLSPENAKKKK